MRHDSFACLENRHDLRIHVLSLGTGGVLSQSSRVDGRFRGSNMCFDCLFVCLFVCLFRICFILLFEFNKKSINFYRLSQFAGLGRWLANAFVLLRRRLCRWCVCNRCYFIFNIYICKYSSSKIINDVSVIATKHVNK